MVADLGALLDDPADQVGLTLCVLAQQEEGGAYPLFFEDLEDVRGRGAGTVVEGERDHPVVSGPVADFLPGHALAFDQGRDPQVEISLTVDRQPVDAAVARIPITASVAADEAEPV